MQGERGPSFRGRPPANAVVVILVAVVFILSTALAAAYLSRRTSAQPIKPNDQTLNTTFTTPVCGRLDDRQIHLPPMWETFAPPKRGESYRDPVYGCEVTRVTDGVAGEPATDGKHVSLMNYYSTFSPMNAGDTMLLLNADDGTWRVTDLKGDLIVPSKRMPAMNDGHPVWDAAEANVFYYAKARSLEEAKIVGDSQKSTVLHDFSEYKGITSPDAADLSQDGDHIALVGQNADNTMDVFVWSLSKSTKTSVYKTKCAITKWDVTESPQPGCVHKIQITPNNLLSIEFESDGNGYEQGLRLWDGEKAIPLQDRTNHYDTGYDLSGDPIFIEIGGRDILPGQRNSCASGWGLEVRELESLSSAKCLLDRQPPLHVSYRGGKSQPWAAISFFDDRKRGPEFFSGSPGFEAPSMSNWRVYEDEIAVVRIDGRAIYRLAQGRSRSAEGYWDTPRAAISRDGKYVVFTSNSAYPNGCPSNMHVPDECTDVYLIKAF